jgi:hypothetical protein
VYHSGIVVPRDVGSAGVGLVHGHWFFWVAWFVRHKVYHSGIVVPRDVDSAGVELRCVVRVERLSDAPFSPGTSEAYLINLVRSRCTEQASYWVDQWVENNKGGTYAELLAAFHAQFVASREVQTLHRIQLSRTHQRPGSTVEQFYAYMAERCVGLAQPPAEVYLVTTLTYGLIDLPMRMAVASRESCTHRPASAVRVMQPQSSWGDRSGHR